MNMRKIIAVLSAALLLCAAIPMGALTVVAAPGDVIIDADFNDGMDGFNNFSVADGALVLDGTSADWANSYAYANNIKPGTTYQVNFRAKADAEKGLAFKINNGWSGTNVQESVTITTEWKEFELLLTPDSTLTSPIFTIQTGTYASGGTVYYIDYVKVTEWQDPAIIGKVVNGDFENGSEGWTLNSSASIEDGALKLDNSGAWSEAAMANFAVEVGTEYTLSWKSQRISGSGAFLMFVLNADNSNHPTSGANWMNETSGNWVEQSIKFTAEAANLKLKISPEVNEAGVILIDDIKLTAKKPGEIVNGDFEAGFDGWNTWQGTVIGEGRNGQGANLKGNGGWGGMLDQTIPVEAGKTYKISMWAKANANGTNVQIKDGGTSGDNLASQWFTKAEWTELVWEVIPTTDVICINFCGGGNGIAEDVLVDDITIAEVKVPSFDGYLYNGDFETGEAAPWTMYSGTAVSADAAYTGNYGVHITNPTGGWGGTAYQDFTIEVGKTYNVTMWAKTLDGARGQNIQIQNPIGTNVASKWFDNTPEWTLLSFEFTATTTDVRINICGGGTGSNEEIYVDDIKVTEVSAPVVEGIWNADFNDGEKKFSVGEVVAEGPDGSNCYKWTASGGWSATYTTLKNMDPNKDYSITMKVKASVDGSMGVTIQNGDWGAYWNAPAFVVTTEWQDVIYTIPANSIPFAAGSILFKFQDVGKAMDLYVDDIVIIEGLLETPSLKNGDFETGKLAPWENLWGSNTVEIVEGKDGYGLHIVSGKWQHVRQTNIAVEANTWYKVTLWAKNTNNMCALVKNGADTTDIINKGITAGDEWTEFSYVFNTGDYTTIIFSLMGGEIEGVAQEGTFDNISLEITEEPVCEHEYEFECSKNCKLCGEETRPEAECESDADYLCQEGSCNHCGETVAALEHEYFYACDKVCMLCYEITNPDADHSVIHVAAKDAASCIDFGNKEYWACECCGTAWLDADQRIQTNLKSVMIVGECVSDSPACKDGVCINCTLPCPAEAEHTYDDEYDADCNACGDTREVPEKPVDVVYGDANGDGEINALDSALLAQYLAGWDVELNAAAADANGDGETNALDSALLAQFLAGWDVSLGSN